MKTTGRFDNIYPKTQECAFFSIGQVIDGSVYDDDFRRGFGHIDGAVALDLDERFAGWNWEFLQSVAIKSAEVWGCWMGWFFIDLNMPISP